MTTANSEVKKTLDAIWERRVVESGKTSTGWWRKWSDGFIEQGGYDSTTRLPGSGYSEVSLFVPFATKNYVVNSTGGIDRHTTRCQAGTTTAFRASNYGGSDMGFNWVAYGY